MPKQLPGVWPLLQDSWRLFTATWNQTAEITLWFLYIGLAFFAVSVLSVLNPGFALLALAVQLAATVISIWCGLRLLLALLRLVDGKPVGDLKAEAALAWPLLLPLVVVGLLQGLVVLGGFVLLIIPGIYLAILLGYAQIIFVDQGVRGWQALAASRDLVRGRWWAVFWRNFAASLAMGLGLALMVLLVLGLFGLIAGPERFFTALGSEDPNPILDGAVTLLDSILQAAFLPLILGFQVRLYRRLQETR